jgi:capsular exopolysaccharide synthesis family protein
MNLAVVASDARGMMVRGTCRNVSEGGVCAVFAAQFAMNDEFSLRIILPDTAIELPLRAVVRHVNGRQYGFKFLEVSDAQRGQLRQLKDLRRTVARGLVALTDACTVPAEKFSILANRLTVMRNAHHLKVVHITSSVPNEGKSFVAANLAVTLARRPQTRVLLVEGDLRRPALSRVFGQEYASGLGEWWRDGTVSRPDVFRFGDLPLWLLPAGRTEDPENLLHSPRLPELLAELAEEFDWVILDSPPLLPLADASTWARLADGSLVVVRAGVATRKALQKALESLDRAKLLGFVLNDAAESMLPYYEQYYGSRKSSEPKPQGALHLR